MAAAAHLVRKGMPFRRAHELVGKAVRLGLEKTLRARAIVAGGFRALRNQGRSAVLRRAYAGERAGHPRRGGRHCSRARARRPCKPPRRSYPCIQEPPMHARSAKLPDALAIEQLIQVHVGDGTLLPRSLRDICENIRDFIVVENEGEIVGCGALHLYGMHLAEIRSITVTTKSKGKGAGRVLVDALAERGEASERDLRLSVHAHSRLLRTHGVSRGGKGSAARQGAQGLPAVPAPECLRRDCDVPGHPAEGCRPVATPAQSPALRPDSIRPALSCYFEGGAPAAFLMSAETFLATLSSACSTTSPSDPMSCATAEPLAATVESETRYSLYSTLA